MFATCKGEMRSSFAFFYPCMVYEINLFTGEFRFNNIKKLIIMNEKQLSEKESLEIISRMINSTKQNMEVGQGNVLLYWGYATFIVSLLVTALVYFTGNLAWCWAWSLLFLLQVGLLIQKKKNPDRVVSYVDQSIHMVWQVVGRLFGLTFLALLLYLLAAGKNPMILMMPLSLLYASIGVSITGIFLRQKSMIYFPIVVIILAIYMLLGLTYGGSITVWWNLYFGIAFVFMMVIPGHLLNSKMKK